uniref:Uncharacterized protein n=1 Tax=Lotus japonicus TaxID=34305 RepID=I3SXK5_LOTJA|nr:unknown [Lotus japonicus]
MKTNWVFHLLSGLCPLFLPVFFRTYFFSSVD